MKKNSIAVVCLLLAFFGAPDQALADKLYFNSGRVVDGKIVEKKDDRIRFETSGVTLTYFRDEIERIEESASEPPPETLPQKSTSQQTDNQKKPDFQQKPPLDTQKFQTPEQVYRAYLQALEHADWNSIKPYISRENIKAVEAGGNVGEAVLMLRDLRVRDLEVIDVIMANDQATLIAYGTTLFGQAEGIVEMISENGEWKISKTNWESAGKAQK